MLIPVQWDLALYPGFQFNPNFVFYEDDARTQPIPLAGYSAQLNVGNGLLLLNDIAGLKLGTTDGSVQVLGTATETAGVPVGDWDWFLEWTPPGGQPDCPVFGVIHSRMPIPSRR